MSIGFFCADADCMADAGDRLPLETGGRGEQCPGGSKEDLLPFSGLQTRQQPGVQNGSRAATSGSAAMHVLALQIIDEHPTVPVDVFHVNAVLGEQIQYNGVSQFSQISRKDKIVILWPGARVPEESGKRVVSGRGHSVFRPIIQISWPSGCFHVPRSSRGDAGIRLGT